MRILVISNLYPPHFIGGYELACENIVEALILRGHDVRVLTSTYAIGEEKIENNVYRLLRVHYHRSLLKATILYKEIVNQKHFRRLCADFAPELIFIWNATGISISLAHIAEQMRLPVCYYVFDNWLATWEMDHWCQLGRNINRLEKVVLKGYCHLFDLMLPYERLSLTRAIFASQYLKDVASDIGKEVRKAHVVHWGIDQRRFTLKDDVPRIPRNLLYVGQIVSLKGVHIAIQALDILVKKHNCDSLRLTIVGDTSFMPNYVSYLQTLISKAGLHEKVFFTGKVDSARIAETYAGHDVLLFPSIWDEPFGITQIEAMSSGLVVLGSATGGSSEILMNEVNSLTFSRGDANHCAEQILRLIREPELYEQLRISGRRTVESKFTFDKVVNVLEEELVGFSHLGDGKERGLEHCRFRNKAVSQDNKRRLSTSTTSIATIFHKVISTAMLISVYYLKVTAKEIKSLLRGKLAHGPAHHQNILVIQLGDVDAAVHTVPLLNAIRRERPSGKIVLIVQPSVDRFLKVSSSADRTIYFDIKRIRNWRELTRGHLWWWLKAIVIKVKLLRICAIHTAISLHYPRDSYQAVSSALLHLSGASQMLGYRDSGDTFINRLHNYFIEAGPVRKPFENELNRQSRLMECLGISEANIKLDIRRHGDRCAFALGFPSTMAELNRPTIAIACGGEFPLRRWPIERFIEIGKWLQADYNARLLIIGDRSDEDIASYYYKAVRGDHVNRVHYISDFSEAMGILKDCTLLLGNETWQLYAAAAAGTPVIGLFGPGDPSRLGYESAENEVIRLDIPCSPCQDNCMFKRPYCMDGLQVERVKTSVAVKLRSYRDQYQ